MTDIIINFVYIIIKKNHLPRLVEIVTNSKIKNYLIVGYYVELAYKFWIMAYA